MRQPAKVELVGFPSIFNMPEALVELHTWDVFGRSFDNSSAAPVRLDRTSKRRKSRSISKRSHDRSSTCRHQVLDWKVKKVVVTGKADEVEISLGFSLARAETSLTNGWKATPDRELETHQSTIYPTKARKFLSR
jgi:hypothetical protein